VFEERKGTLDSSVEYLETLARNYARLSPAIERPPFEVNPVVEEVLRNIVADGAVIQTNLGEHLPRALGDTLMLRRVLENLVGNAVDSLDSRSGGRITITTEAAGGHTEPAKVRISVVDTGPGMTRKELDQAFEDFYTTKADGTGLGLSIVRRLILDLNGTLHVETEPGVGTRFVVELPAVAGGGAQ
jgi:signal transduction histidine kinase